MSLKRTVLRTDVETREIDSEREYLPCAQRIRISPLHKTFMYSVECGRHIQ